MRKLKIHLECRHEGLMRMLKDVWEDHEVHLQEDYPPFPFPLIDGTEDIIVSTLHHSDLPTHTGGKPLIVYATDPFLPQIRELIVSKKILCTVVGAEDCYHAEWFVPVDEWIPFAMKPERYPKYIGDKRLTLVANRKANERFLECSRGTTMEDFLDGVDWTRANNPDKEQFINMYRDYRVLFYFSNSPYTIVMFEAMAVGMPIVAYTHNQVEELYPEKNPVRKYLPFYSTDRRIIVDKLREYMEAETLEPVSYNFIPFAQVKQKWNDLFTKLV